MQSLTRRGILAALGLATAAAFGASADAIAQDRTSVKIGYAISKSGANAGGAGITILPNYQLWVHDVNEAGGLELPDGTKLPIEVIEYDDRSSSEEVVRAVERLATQDKVDFILPPWGTGFNLAAAPLFDRYGYPQLGVAAITDKAPQFVERWPRSFWLMGGGSDYVNALAELLAKLRDGGQINNKIALVSVADGFGIDLVTAARAGLAKAGFEIAYDKTYPAGTSDFTPLINESAATGADSFVAMSYPPDTFALTQQSQIAGFNPKVFYVGIGTAFPAYAANNGENAEGVMGLGGIDPGNAENQAYRERHLKVIGKAPDYSGSAVAYSSLQMLQQAIKRVGLDRDAVSKELSEGTFQTILGEVKLEKNQYRTMWWTGQWQNGVFVGVAPADRPGAAAPVLPKAAWKKP